MRELQIGDIAQITWADHYAYKGKRPSELTVTTWGKVDAIIKEGDPTKDGVALVLNEATGKDTTAEPRFERVMDGQFILSATIRGIQILKRWQKSKI